MLATANRPNYPDSLGSMAIQKTAINKPLKISFNGDQIEVSALLDDGESVDKLIRALEANKPLLPTKRNIVNEETNQQEEENNEEASN